MSYYYKYNFISPEPLYALIQEEFKSYFDTQAIDSLMFPTYVDKCLRKLGRATYVISETILYIEDFQARLPDNFYAVREAWMCTEIMGLPYQTANSFYSQTSDMTIIQVGSITTDECPVTTNDCDDCPPAQLIQAVYKTNHQQARTFKKQYLLKPGNISAGKHCDVNYTDNWNFFPSTSALNEFTPGSSGYDSFDIRDNKFVTNFRNGVIHLIFYATEYDNVGNQLIPDNYRIREYIEAFIKYKLMETLTNQINDETFNQLQQKLTYYKQLSDEAYILALTEIKSQTVYQKQRKIKEELQRFNMYELPSRSNRYSWRRNN